MSANPEETPAPRPLRVWGPFGSLVWALGALAVQYAVIFVVAMAWEWSGPAGGAALQTLSPVSPVIWIGTIAALPFQLGVLELATRGRGGMERYLALVWPARGELWRGLVIVAALIAAFDAFTFALGRLVVPPFMVEAYRAARAAGALPILVLAVAVAAPVWEEFLFRGFLYRGLAETRLRPFGAVIVVALAWAVVHVQYDWYGIAQIFVIGLVFGWLRARSGSTWLAVAAHVLANLIATGQAFVTIEGYV